MSISCCEGADLVVDVLDRDPHGLERLDRVVAKVARGVHRRHGEVAAFVERLGALVVLEEEVLELGADVEGVEAHRVHALERAAQDVAGIAVVGLPVGRDDVADHPRDADVAVRHELEGGRVGNRDHVGFLDRVEPGDRRAVEAHPVVERALELGGRDREALQVAFDVGEPEVDELHALLVHLSQHSLSLRRNARRPALPLNCCHALASFKCKEPRTDSSEASSPTYFFQCRRRS